METPDPGEIPLAERHRPVVSAVALVWRADALAQRALRRLHRARRWPRRGLLALIYAPAIALLLAGVAAAIGLLDGLWQLVGALTAHALDSVPTTYGRLALAGHVALVSGAFVALLCALVVVAVGCRGRRWWRLYLIPAVPLSAVAALLFIFATQWLAQWVTQRLGWPASVWVTLTALALVDAVLVAAHIGGIGAGPLGTRRARLRGRLHSGRTTERTSERARPRQTRPIPVVRFGPRDTGVLMPNIPDEAGAPAASGLVGAPTAEELRAAARSISAEAQPRESVGTPEALAG